MDVFGLLGNPVGHSLSPPMHEAAYDALDVDARYVTFEPAPDDLEAAIEGARALGLAGVNVTVPFKERVLECVEPSSLAARVGAVNTIDFADDAMVGYNTDVAGAVRALECEGGASLDGSTAVVVGAGGAGRAVAFGLADAGATVHVANRTVERATSLAADVAASTPQANAADARETTPQANAADERETPEDGEAAAASRSQGSATRGVDVTGHGLDELADVVPAADVLVNATTVGMEDDESPVPATVLHDGLVVLDAVYAPLETQLLRSARAAGATTVDGAWMLLYQGAAAFERWTGRDAPVDAMNDALRDALE